MTPTKRLEVRKRHQTKKRQTVYRKKCALSGRQQLQVKISRLAHSKAKQIVELGLAKNMTELYAQAIRYALQLPELPTPHLQVIEGDLVGYRRISPWVDSQTHKDFYENVLPSYNKSRIALSSVIYHFCMSLMHNE